MELGRKRLSKFFSEFRNFWGDLQVAADGEKLRRWHDHFRRDYPEVFRVEMEPDERAVQERRDKKLVKIKERLLRNRSGDRFTEYDGITTDTTKTIVEKLIACQKAIDDATRRKIYFASLQGELLETCFKRSKKKTYKETLQQANIGVRWAQFLKKLYKLVLAYNQLAHCTVSLRFFRSNLMFMEEICKTDPGNWQ